MKREPFTGREHIVIGRKLWAMHNELLDLQTALYDAYGAAVSRKVASVEKSLSKLRSLLDDQVSREHPMNVHHVEGLSITSIYYGGAETERGGRPDVADSGRAVRDRLRAEAAALQLPAKLLEPT